MALWSVALFGHEKPKVEGWERRAKPGDIIAVRPIEEANRWTPTEHKEFLIIELDGFTQEQLAGLVEPRWDTNSYPVLPDDYLANLAAEGKTGELRPQRYINKRRFNIQLADLSLKGVDVSRMLDRERDYRVPGLRFTKTEIVDRVRGTLIPADAKMRLLTPLKVGRVF